VYRSLTAVLAALALLIGACGGAAKQDGPKATGSAFTVSLPGGWTDTTAEAEESDLSPGVEFDRLLEKSPSDGFATNVNVLREAKTPDAELGEIVAAGQEQVKGADATDISPPDKTELGGEPAFEYTYAIEQDGQSLRGKQVAAIYEDRVFFTTFTARDDSFEDEQQEFQEILDSWEWK
jgi:hypothetical protein